MAVAFDAASSNSADDTGNISFTHTPVGTPRGVLVYVQQEDTQTDEVSSITYGGVSMTEISLSPLIFDGILNDSVVHGYFLGSSIPTGAQTVSITVSGSSGKRAACITVTASKNTEISVVDSQQLNSSGASDTIALGGVSSFVSLGGISQENVVGSITPLTGWTERQEVDMGSVIAFAHTYNTVGSDDVTFGGSSSIPYPNILVVAIKEAAGGGATTLTAASGSFALTGNATGLAAARKITASVGTYTLTGVAAGLSRAFTLGTETAAYTLTGVATGLQIARSLATDTASYSFNGNAVNLTHATAGTIAANTGTFSLAGVSTGLTVARKLAATTGDFAFTGNAAGLAIGYSLPAITGAYTLTGIDVTLTAAISKRLPCETGLFVVSGKAVDLVLDTGRQGDGTITKQGIAGKKIAKVKSKEQLRLERIFGKEEEPSELVARLLEPVIEIPADIKQEVKDKDSLSKAKVILAYTETYKETLKATERKKVDQILVAYEESLQKRMVLRRQEEELLLLMAF